LYDPRFEHDACGVGFVARLSGQPGHDIVAKAVEAVANLSHRGAVAADGKSGDGSGVLTQIPRRLVARELERLGLGRLEESDVVGVGMFFLPADDLREASEGVVQAALECHGVRLLGWRDVPIDAEQLGEAARTTLPRIRQAFVVPGRDGDFEQSLYLAHKEIERRAQQAGLIESGFYVASLSCRTLVYKGLFAAHQLPAFYLDLRDPDYTSALAVFHQRYSTNTYPTWQLAQPFRLLAHNGEINTLLGNRAWMQAREASLPAALRPVIWAEGSDSTSLDEALHLLERGGRNVLHALSVLMPAAWQGNVGLAPQVQDFYRYHAPIMEPWDGPAALAFADGRYVGAALDRNGLRPCRYKVTAEGLVVAGSEVGAIELDDYRIVEKGRLGPGQMLALDLERHTILHDDELKRELGAARPWGSWIGSTSSVDAKSSNGTNAALNGTGQSVGETTRKHLTPSESPPQTNISPSGFETTQAANGVYLNGRDQLTFAADAQPLPALQRAFGYTNEDLRIVLRPMGAEGLDAVWSMGDDTPVAPFARAPRSPYAFFRQRFAQVTNPPIDPLRESLVMSLRTWLGPKPDLLQVDGAHPPLIELNSPIIDERALGAIRAQSRLRVAEIDATFWAESLETAAGQRLESALDDVCASAEAGARDGAQICILSDRQVDATRIAIPMLLALGAVHQRLLATGLRTRVDLVVEAGDAWDVHHLAALIGYGAGAVCPWLALRSARALGEDDPRKEYPDAETAEHNYLKATAKGLLKIMSKMGISTVSSYRGGQIFECLGLGPAVVERCFTGTASRIGGLGFEHLGAPILQRHAATFHTVEQRKLPDFGLVRFRREGERHAWEPAVIRALHRAIADDASTWDEYRNLTEPPDEPAALRDLLEILPAGEPVPVDQVEPWDTIVTRFVCTAMSLGALSPEAHETLAVGMNRLGARSNSGEGGEDPSFYRPHDDGDRHDNKIKQVASARFGVNARYLAHAEELEIKMAQGSKPGEGGQLPAHKVTDLIARLRHAVPGSSLISPPPHHDIYSIEDLAQLIYDLKRVNPRARIGVKLVSEAGVGTVAAGVAKAYADYVLVSGFDGGTGASPLTSIKHAGSPWELGVAETQQVLVRNGLRGRIRLRTDGGLRRARDVVIAALLGAEEYGFGTASLVAIGCDMARQCHLNTCPTGIATQRADLRAKFKGTPEQVIDFFVHLAEEIRELLASLGLRSIDEAVGRVDLLRQTRVHNGVDLSAVLADPDPSGREPRRCVQPRNDRPESQEPLDERLLRDAVVALGDGARFKAASLIRNRDRSVGARIAGEIGAGRLAPATAKPGVRPLPFFETRFVGSAGQSFGAFTTDGMRLTLEGEANDYLGKGMSGGEIVLMPADMARFAPHKNTIVGNTVLYGATGGRVFAAGRAGERFCVRNSGATAVVEGVGDHGCEYMTGGTVLVLGETGRNFGAGMTNGVAYVLDETGEFPKRLNDELVSATRLMDADELSAVYELVREHFERTASRRAEAILDVWDVYRGQFWKVAPRQASIAVEAAHSVPGAAAAITPEPVKAR
jgi:glutamate synthase domain-containing protein 2/glutamate synthase domain-containing protein 1/glutamate synthase domain-containing protein 3